MSCSQSVTVVIFVVLPMSKSEFSAIEEKYIESVATTAGVVKDNVKVLSVSEISTRAFQKMALRMLLATSVNVQTSVLLANGQQTNIEDQTVLDANLVKNGLPMTLQFTTTQNSAPSASGSATTSNIEIGAITGGAIGVLVFAVCVVLVVRRWNQTSSAAAEQVLQLKRSNGIITGVMIMSMHC